MAFFRAICTTAVFFPDDGVFLPCHHGLDFDVSLFCDNSIKINQSINDTAYNFVCVFVCVCVDRGDTIITYITELYPDSSGSFVFVLVGFPPRRLIDASEQHNGGIFPGHDPVDPIMCVCVCFLPIHSGLQWTYQPGSHRKKVTQDFPSTFFLRCLT